MNALNISSLIVKATTSARCFVEARNAFRRTYATASFYVLGPFSNANGISESNDRQIIQIESYSAIKDVLNLFGDMIQFIEVSFLEIDEADGIVIGEYISDNCIESLIELNLKYCHGLVLNKFRTPFKQVNITNFSTDRNNIDVTTIKLNKLFPNLKRLSVNVGNVDDWPIIGNEFSSLRSLVVVIPKPKYLGIPDIESLLNNSKNINHLELSYSSLNLLKAASICLPNLNVLSLNEFADDFYTGDNILFRNVRYLWIYSSRNNTQIPSKLIFGRLLFLGITLNFTFNDHWSQFFENQSDGYAGYLLIAANGFRDKHLSTIASYKPSIENASIFSKTKISANDIISFIESSSLLASLELKSAFIGITERSAIEARLQRLWDIHYYETSEGHFIRFTR